MGKQLQPDMRLAGRTYTGRGRCLVHVSMNFSLSQKYAMNLLCLPGGLRGPSNLPIPPDGVVGPLEPFNALGGGIFKEPVLICLYSDGIL